METVGAEDSAKYRINYINVTEKRGKGEARILAVSVPEAICSSLPHATTIANVFIKDSSSVTV